MVDMKNKMSELREERDAIRAKQEREAEPEVVQTEEEKERTRLRVNAATMRDMSGETFRESYIVRSATELHRRAVAATNGH